MAQKHINLLVDGMNLDSHPSLQPPNSYREANNGTLISVNGNNYSYEYIDGTTFNWQQPEHKLGEGKFIPIGFLRLGDRLLVHSTDNKSTVGGPGEIGIVTFNNAGVGAYSAKYYHEDLRYTQVHMIFGYGLEENDNYHRSYWTDNFNQPRTINTASAVITTEYTSGGLESAVGVQYMVLTDSVGSITYNGVDYGPKQTAGNIFTTTGGITTFTINGSAKVIGYLDPNILNYTPEKAIGTIDFKRYIFGGSLFCGVNMYAYQLTTDDGYESSWSYILNPIHIGPNNPAPEYQKYQGGDASTNTGKGIELTIKDIPTIFTQIKVAVIEINSTIDVITNTEIFWISDITGTEMTITHYGGENLLPLDIDDISLRKAVLVRVKDIATLKQFQVVANITERQELDWALTGVTASPFTYEIPADNTGLASGGGQMQFAPPFCPSTGVVSGNIFPGAHYVVRDPTSGTGSITYNSVVVPVGETFVGVSGVTSFLTGGTAIVKGCIRTKNYDKFGGGESYKIIDLENEWFDYKSMASHCYLKGYWREETYRLAVVAWDLFGNPYAARWIDDITMPSQSDASGLYKLTNIYGTGDANTKTSLNALGIRIDGLDITSIKDKISGISIVRVPRDKTILAQSMILQCVEILSGTTTCPVSVPSPAYDYWAIIASVTIGYTWNLLSPELDFGTFSIPLISGDELKPVSDLGPLTNSGLDTAITGVDEAVYSKYYQHNSFTLPGGAGGLGGYSPKLALVATVSAGGTLAYNAGGFPYTFKNHDILTSGSNPAGVGASSASSMQQKGTTGGQRTLAITDTADFLNQDFGSFGTGVSSVFLATSRKILANYVRPKAVSSLYGGQSDAAKANNKYIFTGHYLKIDDTVLADIVDSSGNYILNGMEVWGGDCFVNMYDRVSSMFNSDYNAGASPLNNGSNSWGVIFPCESEINVGLRQQHHMGRDGLHDNADGVLYKDAFSTPARGLQNEKYFYNSSYSSSNNQVQYDALPLGLRDTGRFPYMARYSKQKFLGETIDNMRIFLINNFRNSDAMHGEINNVAIGFDRLFYWQNKGIGYFPVNERETTVGALGQAVQLGVGGVMERYDTMDKFYGNQHQSSLITGEDFFMWYDMRRFAILRMTFNGGVANVSVVKGLQTFLENAFKVAEADAFNVLNMDQPIMGQGVIGVYDPIKKTAYHTFKFSSEEYGPSGDLARNRDFTVGISSTLGKFVGFFSFAPVIYIEHNSKVYAVKKTRQAIIGLTSYNVGDEVVDSGSTYTCIVPFTSSDPFIGSDYPTALVRWKKTGEEDEVHRMFNGETGKFFGVVYPWNISIVVNPMIDGQKSYDNCEAYGNDTAFSDVFCSTENLSGSDVNITTTNKNYVFFDGKWNFNLPLAGKQRMVDQYMIIKLQVKNYVTDVTTGLNLKKRLVYLKTIFRLRK